MSDLRDALRTLRAAPVVSAVALLSLALGIGANTAIFSIVNSLLLRSLPVSEPQQLSILTAGRTDTWTYPIWEQVRSHSDLFEGTGAWARNRFNAARRGETNLVEGLYVSGGFFDLLGVTPLLGRTISADDDRRGGGQGGPVAVISYDCWQRRFDGAVDAIGKTITLDRVPFTVVGITPPGFFGPEVGHGFEVAVPFGTDPLMHGQDSALDRRSNWWLQVMVRRKAAQSAAAAAAAIRGVQPQIRDATLPPQYRPQDKDRYLKEPFEFTPAARGTSALRDRYQRPLLTIMVVVALVLLVACANVANLLLARASARRHEMSVRTALGASRWRLARQLLVESLLLSGTGALLGLAFASWGGRLLVRQLSTRISAVSLDLRLDWRVLAFTAIVAVATAVLFGTVPALRASRAQPADAMKEQGRSVHGQGPLAAGNLLVVAQVALSLVLVVAAGLFVRTFTRLESRPLGFERGKVLVLITELQDKTLSADRRRDLFATLRDTALTVPGVDSASLSAVTPVSGSSWNTLIDPPDGIARPERDRVAYVNVVSPDFFRTFGTRLLAGRDFTGMDRAGAPPVAIVNETFARAFNSSRVPVGVHLREPALGRGSAHEREIVGYVQDAVYRDLRQEVPPTIYIPAAQQENQGAFMHLSLRAAAGSPILLVRPVADALTRAVPDIALTARTLSEQVDNSLVQERLIAMLSGFFGALALLLAAIGLYSLTSYAVARRRTEIGIRVALGAAPAGVIRLVLRRVAALVACGVVLGTFVALWASTLVSRLLFGLTPRDPVTLVGGVLALALTGIVAGAVPAWRASRIDPALVLRD